tara:strand:+ start:4678 stop:5175 length:498 start_codon:yes stop_codon:yes gene_type:complete
MAWTSDMVTVLRYIIDDVDSPQTYTDSRLQTVIVTAAQLTKEDITFSKTYTLDLTNITISPDPTAATRDDGFINLVSLKAACLLAGAEFKTEAAKGINIRDGSSAIDTRGVSESRKDWRNHICNQYDQAERDYKMGNSKVGEAIVGPYRSFASRHGTDPRNRPTF